MREAIKKYNKSTPLSATASETPTLPSLLSTTNKVDQTVSEKNRNVSRKYPRQRKNKILSDITDMYAVGLRLTKWLKNVLSWFALVTSIVDLLLKSMFQLYV